MHTNPIQQLRGFKKLVSFSQNTVETFEGLSISDFEKSFHVKSIAAQ
jgi:hypothetical protein